MLRNIGVSSEEVNKGYGGNALICGKKITIKLSQIGSERQKMHKVK